jgi:hypothetical protein
VRRSDTRLRLILGGDDDGLRWRRVGATSAVVVSGSTGAPGRGQPPQYPAEMAPGQKGAGRGPRGRPSVVLHRLGSNEDRRIGSALVAKDKNDS